MVSLFDEAGEHVEKRRLPRAVRPDERMDHTYLVAHVDIIRRAKAAKLLRQAVNREQRHGEPF